MPLLLHLIITFISVLEAGANGDVGHREVEKAPVWGEEKFKCLVDK